MNGCSGGAISITHSEYSYSKVEDCYFSGNNGVGSAFSAFYFPIMSSEYVSPLFSYITNCQIVGCLNSSAINSDSLSIVIDRVSISGCTNALEIANSGVVIVKDSVFTGIHGFTHFS